MDKRSKENFKASLNVQKRVSDGIDANAFRKPRQATQLSKQTLKESKKNLKVRRTNYRKLKAGSGLQVVAAKKKYLEAKADKNASKVVFKKQRNLIQHEQQTKRKAMPRIKPSKQQSTT